MTQLPYAAGEIDVVVDVFSTYCLDEAGFQQFAADLARVLRPGGQFFSYTPSKASDIFKDSGSARLDASTLDGIRRPSAPYFGNFYPFRFASPEDVKLVLHSNGLKITSLERIGRTYRNGAEYFEFLSFVAKKE